MVFNNNSSPTNCKKPVPFGKINGTCCHRVDQGGQIIRIHLAVSIHRHHYAVEKFQDHRRLLHFKGPAVIIAGSGMCTGGRIVSHLKHGMDDPKNDLFFVGYQAKGTPGRAIVQGRTPAKAVIHQLTGYSAHADQKTLCDWVKSNPGSWN